MVDVGHGGREIWGQLNLGIKISGRRFEVVSKITYAIIFCKGQDSKYFSFVGHTIYHQLLNSAFAASTQP